ncbi:MAG: Uncharacterized protein JWM93_2481 [Frankiales bacterium]|nr:Uncharacterized protein [Frankiales bacterium]
MSDKEVTKLVKALEAQGFTCDASGKNYWLVKKGGEFVVKIASTPSDHRWLANTIAKARRHGFVWPPPSKKQKKTDEG